MMCPAKKGMTLRRSRRGATMVEFAFVFMLFLVLTVALMDLGRGVWAFTTVAHAARQGARFAVVHGGSNPIVDGFGNDVTDEAIRDVVRAQAIGLENASLTITPAWSSAGKERGSFVEVQVQYPFQLVTGGLVLSQGTIQLGTRSRMVVAN